MRLRGGYNIAMAGRPSSKVRALPVPERLILPLESERFSFSEVRVEDGRRVQAGQILAVDPAAYAIPLLAPYGGTVRLNESEGHVVLDGLEAAGDADAARGDAPNHVDGDRGPNAARLHELVRLGAWQFVSEAHTGLPVDPGAAPSAVIVSTIHLEPFVARGDVQLFERLESFARGLEHIQSFLEYEPIYLVLPNVSTPFARKVRESVRGYAWIQLVSVPLCYPFDDSAIIARHLGLSAGPGAPVWALPTAGIFAFDEALTFGRPCAERIVSLGGPAVDEPEHLRAVPGYPISEILAGRVRAEPVRVLRGGILMGRALGREDQGLDAECRGLTVLEEPTDRQLLSFARPGLSRRSYGKTFLSWLCPGPPERLKTALRGELRPCIACGQCVDVCPARIMPSVIHKHLYRDDLECVIDARVDLCVECGLCSYVCPSKIDLRQELLDAKRAIREELEMLEEAEA